MKTLTSTAVPEWANFRDVWVPASMDAVCPTCRRIVNLSFREWSEDNARKTFASTAKCPACPQPVHVWIVEPATAIASSGSKEPGCIAMYPTPSESWKPLDDLEFLPEDLAQDYAAAVQNYDAEIWAGCLALSR